MLISYIRTLILYTSLIVVIRLMGKRQIGELEPSELVVAMLLADLAAIPMQDTAISLFAGLVPILTVLAAELILSALSFRYVGFRRIFCGKPLILMDNGKILYGNLKKTRVSVNELIEHLREKGFIDPSTVKYAILETNGQISVIPYPKFEPATAKDAGIHVQDISLPITLICDGKWQEENLQLARKSKTWVTEQLRSNQCEIKNVLLLTVAGEKIQYLAKKEIDK